MPRRAGRRPARAASGRRWSARGEDPLGGARPALLRVELTPSVEARAGDLAEGHRLSGFDAVHLASALVVALAAPLVLATWDIRPSEAARAVGVAALPA